MKIEEVRSIVEAAARAPSVHNTQPWKFASHGEPDAIDVFGDRERMLGVVDPDGRELHISCGAAIDFACIRARSLGRACSVHLLPDPADADHFARIEFGDAAPPSSEDVALEGALEARYTERGRFDEGRVPYELVEELKALAATDGCWIRVLEQPGDEVTTAVLLSRADELERENPAYEQELASWIRADEQVAADGILSSALPLTPPASRGSSFRLRDFDPTTAPEEARTAGDEPPPAEHPLVILLGTPGDDARSWLEAGRALGRLLVRASLDGVFASPMTQVLEVPATRAMLAGQLGLLGYPQILLRLGYGHGRPSSRRRAVDEVLDA